MSTSRPHIAIVRPDDQYRYIIKPTTGEPGTCDICGEPCESPYHQVEQRRYSKADAVDSWTLENNVEVMGHPSCLAQSRRFTTSNAEFRSGQIVRDKQGKRHTIERVGTMMTLDTALIREVTPSLLGHEPVEAWYPLMNLNADN